MSNVGQTTTSSTSVPTNGKKTSNGSTPVTTPQMHNTPPPSNNAPKYGTLVPNRIFVGGISANTTEGELLQLFSGYGTVKAAKIIQDRAGVSKGYGFITFENEDDAKRPLREADNIVLRERKLNIAPAIKKQPFNYNRAFDGSSPPAVTVGTQAAAAAAAAAAAQYFLPPGVTMPAAYFQAAGGVGYYGPPPPPPPPQNGQTPGDPSAAPQTAVYQPPPVYQTQTGPPQAATYPSMMFPAQTIYMPQQYPMPMPYDYAFYPNNGTTSAAATPPQYIQNGGGGHLLPPPPSGSPPRNGAAICYAAQQPMYAGGGVDAAATAFYYANVPFYAEMPQPLYAEAMMDPSGGTLAGHFNEDQHHHHQHHFINNTTTTTTTATSSDYVSSTTSTTPDYYDDNEQKHHNNNNNIVDYHNLNNNTKQDGVATPVVSLLDHGPEKDFDSMQSGRKKNYHQTMSSTSRRQFNNVNGWTSSATASRRQFTSACNNNRRQFAESTRIIKTTGVTTPPPAPYSPLSNYGYGGGIAAHNIRLNSGVINAHRYNNYNNSYRRYTNYNNNNNKKFYSNNVKSETTTTNEDVKLISQSPSFNLINDRHQVHYVTSQGNGGVPQSSSQSAYMTSSSGILGSSAGRSRSRKPARRSASTHAITANHQHGNEIGAAGDASQESGGTDEVAVKIETLKL